MTTPNELDKTKTEEATLDNELTLDQLDTASGGLGTVIPSSYKKSDGDGIAAFYAGICMDLMGL